MSGIIAAYGSHIENTGIQAILKKLKHRGPNAVFRSEFDKLIIAETYFSLKPGDTNCCTFDKPLKNSTVIDGRIFNREELAKKFDNCETDGELALKLYQEKGPDFLKELNGMFSMVLVSENGQPFIARDPLGIKPLYYGHKNGTIYFASEIKALVGYTNDIKFFPPGHYFTPEEGFKQYIDFEGIKWAETNLDEALNKVKNLLEKSVLRQIPGETVPAALLSGGIDSSLIAAAASRHVNNLKTFCVGTEGAGDIEAARKVADFLGTDHKESTYNKQDIQEVLPEIIYYMESFDPSLIRSSAANYFAYKLVGDNARVIFSGEGGDELFGGYSYLKELEGEERFHKELVNFFYGLHNVGLQRVDRMSMAYSKECRMPFLDMNLLQYAATLPPKWKIYGPEKMEKWILRKAFEGWIPDDILWRVKQEFSQGSKTVDVMKEIAEEQVSDSEFERERNAIDPPLRNKEEVMNYRIFRKYFDDDYAAATVGRWVTN
ncbi:MAG: hypothetical protein K9L17_10000 [Clostridiales bacterium]|nr:hypothetical protein [Clostridiales bacterium]MCF8023012.1 hypothetical protein [Clostridiales bacterium]